MAAVIIRSGGANPAQYRDLVAGIADSAGDHSDRLVAHRHPAVADELGLPLHLTSAQVRELGPIDSASIPRLSASVHSLEELRAAKGLGVSWALLSPVFRSASKPEQGTVLGIDGFTELAAASQVPLIALSGVLPRHAAELAGAKASGLAAMGPLCTGHSVVASLYVRAAAYWWPDTESTDE